MPDWTAVKADFLATGMAYPALAKKWNVSISSLKKRAAKEKWNDGHAAVIRRTEPELVPFQEPNQELVSPLEYAERTRIDRVRRMLSITDAMMDRIINAMEIVKPDDTYAIRTLIAALKDLRDIQGLNKSALDIEEQKARIAKLRSETRITENEEAGGVLILPTIDERLEPPEAEP